MEIRLHPKSLAMFLAAVTMALGVLNLLSCIPVFMGTGYPFGSFNFDYENNIPTLFSTLLLCFCATLAFFIARSKKSERLLFLQWLGIAAAFLFLGIDESTSLHERLTEPVRNAVGTGAIFYYAWVIPYAVLLAVFVAIYLRFFFRLPPETRKWVAIGAVLYVGGGIGLELPGGAWYELHGKDAVFYLLATFEELLEMTGCILFIYAFSSYIDRHIPDFKIRITSL